MKKGGVQSPLPFCSKRFAPDNVPFRNIPVVSQISFKCSKMKHTGFFLDKGWAVMYGEGISYPRSPSGHKEGAVWDEKTVARAQTMDTPHRHRRGSRGAQFFLTVHVACAVAARLHAPADLLQHLAARSAVPSSAPHPDEPSNRHEPWPLRADAPVASGHRAGSMHGRPHAHGHGGGHHHRYARRQRGLPRGLRLPEQPRHRRTRAAGPAAHRHGADRHALPRNHVQRVHARGAHHAFPPADRLAHPIRRPQGQRRAAALGHSGLLPVGGDARHPYGRHL